MLKEHLQAELHSLSQENIPLPGGGNTSKRHERLFDVGRKNLSLARLAEAHWDAVAILAEAGREPQTNAIYGVWASERPGQELKLDEHNGELLLTGSKAFCSGAGIVDRALVTVSRPEQRLVDVDLRDSGDSIDFDDSDWKTSAFRETHTSTAHFKKVPIVHGDFVGGVRWYLERSGFWHGACGPASCWAGGAAGLVDYAEGQSRHDPHTLAHLGAMKASVWALCSYLESAGREIDLSPHDCQAALVRALTLRHLVEQACTDILRRLPRAYGPHPLAMDKEVAARYQELDLYLRQSHAERDLESLGREVRTARATAE
jgi:alkylation response protein AidB-like acyl-CoA dehydrogenase